MVLIVGHLTKLGNKQNVVVKPKKFVIRNTIVKLTEIGLKKNQNIVVKNSIWDQIVKTT